MAAEHSHGPVGGFVTGCPLCDEQKETRNRAISHLSEALYLLAGLRGHDERATLRLNLGPIGITGDDVHRCHSFDLSAKQAEGLCDAIDSMNAYLTSRPDDSASPAAVFARRHPAAAALIADTFDEIFAEADPKSFLDDVFTAPDPAKSGLAYEALLGSEDGDL